MPKTKWRTIRLEGGQIARAIESTWGSSKKALRGDQFAFTLNKWSGGGEIETNLPMVELRRLFSFSGVPFPRDYITADKSIDEEYADWLTDEPRRQQNA